MIPPKGAGIDGVDSSMFSQGYCTRNFWTVGYICHHLGVKFGVDGYKQMTLMFQQEHDHPLNRYSS